MTVLLGRVLIVAVVVTVAAQIAATADSGKPSRQSTKRGSPKPATPASAKATAPGRGQDLPPPPPGQPPAVTVFPPPPTAPVEPAGDASLLYSALKGPVKRLAKQAMEVPWPANLADFAGYWKPEGSFATYDWIRLTVQDAATLKFENASDGAPTLIKVAPAAAASQGGWVLEDNRLWRTYHVSAGKGHTMTQIIKFVLYEDRVHMALMVGEPHVPKPSHYVRVDETTQLPVPAPQAANADGGLKPSGTGRRTSSRAGNIIRRLSRRTPKAP